SGNSISDENRITIQNRITAAQDDPELVAKAQAVRQEIEREAAARSAAIAGLIGTTAADTVSSRTPRGRRGGTSKPADEYAERTSTSQHKRAAIYVRTASTSQEDAGAVERQIDSCRQTSRDLGATVTLEFVDKGVPGTSLDRTGLQGL